MASHKRRAGARDAGSRRHGHAVDHARSAPTLRKTQARRRTLPLDQIIVGNRHSRGLGDINGLATSVREMRLLQPTVGRPDGKLIAGERRVPAAERLGWTTIRARSRVNLEGNVASIVSAEDAAHATAKFAALVAKCQAKPKPKVNPRPNENPLVSVISGTDPEARVARALKTAARASDPPRPSAP